MLLDAAHSLPTPPHVVPRQRLGHGILYVHGFRRGLSSEAAQLDGSLPVRLRPSVQAVRQSTSGPRLRQGQHLRLRRVDGFRHTRCTASLLLASFFRYFFGNNETLQPLAALLGDLHRYDPLRSEWLDLSGISEDRPSPRMDMGFTAYGNSIYLFGGYGPEGTRLASSWHGLVCVAPVR